MTTMSKSRKLNSKNKKLNSYSQELKASGKRPDTSGFIRQMETTDENNSLNLSILVTHLRFLPTITYPQPLQHVLQQ